MKAKTHINHESGSACPSLVKGYLSDYPILPEIPQDLTDRIIDEINQGVMIGNNGHGSTQHFAHGDTVNTDDIPGLSNDQRLPVMVMMTCLNGYIAMPNRSRFWQKRCFCRMEPWPPSPQGACPVPGPDSF